MPENHTSQHYASATVEQIITGEEGRESGEVVFGEVDDSFTQAPRYARIPKHNLARGVIESGDTGVGISTATINLLLQLAYDGHGFCYVDPKGDAAVDLLQRLPEDRLDDVVFVGQLPRFCDGEKYDRGGRGGFNLLETPGQKVAPEGELLTALLETLNLDDYLGPKTLRSLRYACAVASELDKPLSDIQEIYEMEEDDFAERDITVSESVRKWLTDVDIFSADMSPLLRRTQEIAMNPVLQETFTPDGASIYDAVEDEKIIIAVATVEDQEVKQIMATGLLGKLYDVLQSGVRESSDDLFPVAIDNIDYLDIPEHLIREYTSIATSYQAPLIGTLTYPAQMSHKTQNTFFTNLDNWLCFRHSDIQSANEITPYLELESRDQLLNLPTYTAISKLQAASGEFTGEVEMFPPIEPQRPPESVGEAVSVSVGD